jgi:hypothetical protein
MFVPVLTKRLENSVICIGFQTPKDIWGRGLKYIAEGSMYSRHVKYMLKGSWWAL